MDRSEKPTSFFSAFKLRRSSTRNPKHTVITGNAHTELRFAASAQHLPHEIIIRVLAYALPSVYHRATNFRNDARSFFNEATHDFRGTLKQAQAALYTAARISRAWYPVAIEFLYGCPFFDTYTNMERFVKTMELSPALGKLVQEAWVFNVGGPSFHDPLGMKRKTARRTQAELTASLRSRTALEYLIVCNHGMAGQSKYPIDNILVYGLPGSSNAPIPSLSLHGPCVFNEPWSKHPKPNNLETTHLKELCMRDIETSPVQLKCAPYLPTLPHLHTLRLAMFKHNETPFVSSGTVPSLNTLEIYRDLFDESNTYDMHIAAVDITVVSKLARLHLIGREVESILFRAWASQPEVLSSLHHLAIGPIRRDDQEWFSTWCFPRGLETLTVVVWQAPESKPKLESVGDAEGVLGALLKCMHMNRQARAFKRLEVRTPEALPPKFTPLIKQIRDKCTENGFSFEVLEDVDSWIAQRLSGSNTER